MKKLIKTLLDKTEESLNKVESNPACAEERIIMLSDDITETLDAIEESHLDALAEKDERIDDLMTELKSLKEEIESYEDDELSGERLNSVHAHGNNFYSSINHLRSDTLYEEQKLEILNRISGNYTLEQLQNLERYIKSKKANYNDFV